MEQLQDTAQDKLCLTVKEMSKVLGVGINDAYQLVKSKGFPVVRFGERKLRIPVAELEKWLQKKTEENRTND